MRTRALRHCVNRASSDEVLARRALILARLRHGPAWRGELLLMLADYTGIEAESERLKDIYNNALIPLRIQGQLHRVQIGRRIQWRLGPAPEPIPPPMVQVVERPRETRVYSGVEFEVMWP